MAEREIKTQKKQEKVELKHRVRQQEREPVFDHFHAWEQGAVSIGETPFFPRMDEHAELLARAPSDNHRANIVLQLQQTYGNRYVQRLIESRVVQAKLNVSAPNDIYEQEADRVARAVTRADKSQVQRQEEGAEEEEEEPIQPKIQRQVEEEEEEPLQTMPLRKHMIPTVMERVGVRLRQRIEDPMTAGLSIQRAFEPGITRKKGHVLDWITVKRRNIHVWLSALFHRMKYRRRELRREGFGVPSGKKAAREEIEIEEGGKKEAKSAEWGHWWIELDTGGAPESYGWWPRDPVSNPFSSKNVGQLNQGEAKDPHHGDPADQEFHPKLTRDYVGWGDEEIRNEIREFATSYHGTWRWLFGWGKNCHTFQQSLMRAVGLKKP